MQEKTLISKKLSIKLKMNFKKVLEIIMKLKKNENIKRIFYKLI